VGLEETQGGNAMKLAVVKEVKADERRVALVPETVGRLIAKGLAVAVEAGAGSGAWFPDRDYQQAGATIEPSLEALLGAADVLVKIHAPEQHEIDLMRPGSVVVGLLYPRFNPDLIRRLGEKRITAVALDSMPRTSMAQVMDVLSSQSTAAGYRAVILAARALPKFLPMLMTPAGTIGPARVLVLGAGVAGLQAISMARRLGAVVEAFDVRGAVKEEIESLGARFIDAGITEDAGTSGSYAREVSAESQQKIAAIITDRLSRTDICITTARLPGRRAPVLITAEMVRGMRPGSVIVDLAADQGGNCALTEPGAEVVREGVTIIGPTNAAGEVAVHASQMFSRNVERLLNHLIRDGALRLDLKDELTRSCVITHDGNVLEAVG